MQRQRKFNKPGGPPSPNPNMIVPLGKEYPIAPSTGRFRTPEEMRTGKYLGNWLSFDTNPSSSALG